MGDLSDHFSKREFACPCGCGFDDPDSRIVDALEELRGMVSDIQGHDTPIVIASGNRCPVYNPRCGGAPRSRHMRADAADIIIPGMTPRQVMKVAERVEMFGGLGVGVTRCHVDTRPRRANGGRSHWTYGRVNYDWK